MDKSPCSNCDDTGWVCEGHADRPWGGVSDRADACECGAGAPCDVCNTGRVPDTGRVIETVIADTSGDKRH